MCLIARLAFLCKAALITLLRLPPARQCCLPTTCCGVGPSAEQHCPRLTSCVQSCLPCVHVQDKLSICRLPSQKNSRNVAHLQIEGVCGAIGYTDGCKLDCFCEDGKEPEIIGSEFKITTRVSDVPTSAAPLCERPKPLFCLRKCCCMLRGEVDDLKEALRSEAICFGSLSVLV